MNKDKRATWEFFLFVSGKTPQVDRMLAILKQICEEYLPDKHRIEMVDIVATPERAAEQNILATPTLLKTYPQPGKRIIGELTEKQKILKALEIVDP